MVFALENPSFGGPLWEPQGDKTAWRLSQCGAVTQPETDSEQHFVSVVGRRALKKLVLKFYLNLHV